MTCSAVRLLLHFLMVPLCRKQVLVYLLIGTLAAAVTGTRAYGLNALPASIYVVCATSDLVFNTILSRFFLKKTFTVYHYSAVVIAMSGIALVATDNSKSTHYECDGDTCADDFLPGIAMAVGSALCSAINSVLADKLLSVDKKSALGVAEVSLFNSMVPFSILWIPMLATEEYTRYDDAVRKVKHEHALAIFIICCIGLGVAKMIDRASKFTIVTQQGAFFYAVADSVRKVLTAVLAIWIFGEEGSWKKYVALLMTALAMCVYIYGTTRKAAAPGPKPSSMKDGDGFAPLLDQDQEESAIEHAAASAPLQISRSHSANSQGGHSRRSLMSEKSLHELDVSFHDIGLSQSPGVLVLPPNMFGNDTS